MKIHCAKYICARYICAKIHLCKIHCPKYIVRSLDITKKIPLKNLSCDILDIENSSIDLETIILSGYRNLKENGSDSKLRSSIFFALQFRLGNIDNHIDNHIDFTTETLI